MPVTGGTPLPENLDKLRPALAYAAGVVVTIVGLGVLRGQPFDAYSGW